MAQQQRTTLSHDQMTVRHRFRGIDYVRLSEEEAEKFQDQDDSSAPSHGGQPCVRLHDPRERRDDCDGKTVYYGLKRGWRDLETHNARRRAGRARKPRRHEIVDEAIPD